MYTLFSFATSEGRRADSGLCLAKSVLDILGLKSPEDGITVLYGRASSRSAYPIISNLIRAQGQEPIFAHLSGATPVKRAALGDTDTSYKNIDSVSIPLSKKDARTAVASAWEAADYEDDPNGSSFEINMPVTGTKKPYLLDSVRRDCELFDTIKLVTYNVHSQYGVFTVATILDFEDIDITVLETGFKTITIPGHGDKPLT